MSYGKVPLFVNPGNGRSWKQYDDLQGASALLVGVYWASTPQRGMCLIMKMLTSVWYGLGAHRVGTSVYCTC